MSGDDRSTACAITWRHDWCPHLFSFRTERPAGIVFVSIASPPAAPYLEFYSIVVPDGPLTQPLAACTVGDAIRIDPTVYGFLRTDRFESGRNLWLLATGTGIAPFLSIVDDSVAWSRFDRIVLVHSVRTSAELAYRERFETLAASATAGAARLTYLPTLTAADDGAGPARGRITTQLDDGRLEERAGLSIDPGTARLMICGNPSMIKDVRTLLGARGMTPVRRDKPGHYIAENFW